MKKLSNFIARAITRLIRLLIKIRAKLQKTSADAAFQLESEDLLLQPIGALPNLAGQERIESDTYKKLFYLMESRGVHVIPNHFYYPIPDTRQVQVTDPWKSESEMVGVELNIDTQLDLIGNVFPDFQEEYNAFPHNSSPELLPYEFHFHNGLYDGMDALVLYCMIRHYKPQQIIEIGSGWSTRISAKAALKNGQTRLTSIEPYPAPFLVTGFPGLNSLLVKKVEEVDLSFFKTLGENDILFIDTSHVIKTGGDVTYLYLEVLPRLKKGVIVHIHDIFLPWEYPKWWITELARFWDEQYLFHAFMVYNSHFHVLLANNFFRHKYPVEVKNTFPKLPNLDAGYSIWIQKTQ